MKTIIITIVMLCLATTISAGEIKYKNNPDGRPSITIGGGVLISGGQYSVRGADQDNSGTLGDAGLRFRIPTSDDLTVSLSAGFRGGVLTGEENLFYYERKSRISNISLGASLTFYL